MWLTSDQKRSFSPEFEIISSQWAYRSVLWDSCLEMNIKMQTNKTPCRRWRRQGGDGDDLDDIGELEEDEGKSEEEGEEGVGEEDEDKEEDEEGVQGKTAWTMAHYTALICKNKDLSLHLLWCSKRYWRESLRE